MKSRILLCLLAMAALSGCQGMISEPTYEDEGPDRPGPTTPPEPTLDECASLEATVGSAPLRRLTRAQVRNALLDVLQQPTLPAAAEARLRDLNDGRVGGFDSTARGPSAEEQRGYVELASVVAADLATEPSALVSCEMSEICARQLFERLGHRLFRRPLTAEELDDYGDIYTTFESTDGPTIAAETALTAMIASPNFLYHAEPITDAREGDTLALVPAAVASRLSFFLWNSVPDEALLEATESGALETEEQVAAQVTRMLEDPKAARHLRSFYGQWLGLGAVGELLRSQEEWTPQLADKLNEEAHAFVADVMTHGSGTLGELLTASHTFGDEEVATHYGASPPDADGRIELDPAQRSGLLTQAGLLAHLGTVFPEIHRGVWLRDAFLCDPIPPPPADVVLDPSVRRLETSPCVGCHERIDPLGFGLAAFDDLGRYDEALAASAPPASVNSPDGAIEPSIVGSFSSPRELGERLAGSPHVEDCVSEQWFRFALGREEASEDSCAVVAIQDEFTRSGGDLHVLTRAIATSPAFRVRSVADLTAPEGEAE